MSFPSLVSGGAECGPSNAMTGLVKNFSRDRSLQQVLFTLPTFACVHTPFLQILLTRLVFGWACKLPLLTYPVSDTDLLVKYSPLFHLSTQNLSVGSLKTYRIASHQVHAMPEAVLRDSEPAVQGSSMEVIRYSNYIATDKQTDSTAE